MRWNCVASSRRLHGIHCKMSLIQERIACQQILSHARSKERLLTPTSSVDRVYVTLKPQLSVHPVYLCSSSTSSAPEYQRVEFSRLRLSAHNLRIETGIWQRMSRELRVCNSNCVVGGVQDEHYALTTCGLCSQIRNFLNISSNNIHLHNRSSICL